MRPPWCVWSMLCHIVLLGPTVLCFVSTVLCWSSVSCRRRRLVKVTHGRGRARMGCLTNAYQRGRPNQKPCGLACGTPYQTLPDPVLAVRNPLVHLAWSWTPYQCLPKHRSGCAAILLCYYQSLPAAVLNTHTMISSILFYILIVGLLAYASYIKNDINRWK